MNERTYFSLKNKLETQRYQTLRYFNQKSNFIGTIGSKVGNLYSKYEEKTLVSYHEKEVTLISVKIIFHS